MTTGSLIGIDQIATPRVKLLNQLCECGHAGWLHTNTAGCLNLVDNGTRRAGLNNCPCTVTADQHVKALGTAHD